jgi:CBS-domain-containing membrane protein
MQLAVTGSTPGAIPHFRSRIGLMLPCTDRFPCDPPPVGLDDPAVLVTTDFRQTPPITVPEHRFIDEALRDMVRFGVRALLVTRDSAVTGLVTSYDIQGERPLQFLQGSTFTRHEEIEVGHIMTPWDQVPMVEWSMLEAARVSDVLEIFAGTAATHLMVVESPSIGAATVRGMISRIRAQRQLRH